MSHANCKLECEQCFYCFATLSPRHEHDHFPIPARAGGNEVVPTCLNCHDFKDRIILGHWPTELAFQAFNEAGPMGRVLIAKCMALVANHRTDIAEAEARGAAAA